MIRLGVVASAAVLAGAGAVWAGETDCGEARLVWADVKDSGSAAAIQSFAEVYAECPIYSQLAREQLAEFNGGASEPEEVSAPKEETRRLLVTDLRTRPETGPRRSAIRARLFGRRIWVPDGRCCSGPVALFRRGGMGGCGRRECDGDLCRSTAERPECRRRGRRRVRPGADERRQAGNGARVFGAGGNGRQRAGDEHARFAL